MVCLVCVFVFFWLLVLAVWGAPLATFYPKFALPWGGSYSEDPGASIGIFR